MLQYLVILLDDTSVSYCHADNPLSENNLIPLDTLKEAIFFGMKENLMIQYVYPSYELPTEYNEVIESIDNIKIGRDVCVCDKIPSVISSENIVMRTKIADFISNRYDIAAILPQISRLNICFTDIESFKDEQISEYKDALNVLVEVLYNLYKSGKQPQVNIITDRLQLSKMHNCGAGDNNITLAPNGKFYLCPAFYYDEKMGVSNRLNHHNPTSERAIGDLNKGLCIPNAHLLDLAHAPLCRNCDAYHCNRCIWLNQKLTWDNNTPSHQQCVLAHLERNASRDLQQKIGGDDFQKDVIIKEINYLDPFDVREKF